MNIDKTKILDELMSYKKFSKKAELARFLNIKPNVLSNWYSRNSLDEDIIINAFPEINSIWLLTGEGNMLNNESKTELKNRELPTDDTHVPLLPISAQGGALSDFADSVREIDCEKILSPIKGVDFAMTISGDSMAPEYPSGAQILIKRINERAFIDWGKVYVLDTCNGSIIKKVYPGNTENKVKCVSINADYPPFEVSFKDIFGMYRVLLCMSLK